MSKDGADKGFYKEDKIIDRFANHDADVLFYLEYMDLNKPTKVQKIGGQYKTDFILGDKFGCENVTYKSLNGNSTSGNSFAKHEKHCWERLIPDRSLKFHDFIYNIDNCNKDQLLNCIDLYAEPLMKFAFLGNEKQYYPTFMIFENDNSKIIKNVNDMMNETLKHKPMWNNNKKVIYMGRVSIQVFDRSEGQKTWNHIQFKYSFGELQTPERLNFKRKTQGVNMIMKKNLDQFIEFKQRLITIKKDMDLNYSDFYSMLEASTNDIKNWDLLVNASTKDSEDITPNTNTEKVKVSRNVVKEYIINNYANKKVWFTSGDITKPMACSSATVGRALEDLEKINEYIVETKGSNSSTQYSLSKSTESVKSADQTQPSNLN